MIIFINAYQHHDPAILQPIANEAARRNWHAISGLEHLPAFMEMSGRKAAVQVADFLHIEHAPGQYLAKQCRDRGIPTVAIQHGFPLGFHDRDAYRHVGTSSSDVYCLWGEYWREWFNAKRFAVTGAPQWDIAKRIDRDKVRELLQANYTEGLDVPMGLLCPQVRDYPGNEWLMSRTMEERADEFIELARGISFEGLWIVRSHPSDEKFPDRMAQHERIAAAIGGVLQTPTDWPLYRVLPGVEVTAGMSTVLLEGMTFGAKPYPIGVEYLPDNMQAMYPQLLTNVGGAAAAVCDVVMELVNERYPVA